MAAITPAEFKLLADYIYQISGIYLEAEKKYLLETRLGPLLAAYQCASYRELYDLAQRDGGDRSLKKEIINAISTNETLFFRDQKPFELLKHKIIPDLIDRRRPGSGGRTKIRIWSAACSTGQEVYSIIISLFEVLGSLNEYDFYILGTDIADEAIGKASYGSYSKFEIERGLPKKVLQRYFQPVANGWRIKDEIRSLAVFKKFNLMEPYTHLGTFDIIFCRNVAIYFADQDKRRLFQKLARTLAPDGYLIIGGSESLTGIAPQFVARHYLQGIFYQLQGAADPPAAGDRKRPAAAGAAAGPSRRRPPAKPSSTAGKAGKRRPTAADRPPPPSPPAARPENDSPPAGSEAGRCEPSSPPATAGGEEAGGFLARLDRTPPGSTPLLAELQGGRQPATPLVLGAQGGRQPGPSLLAELARRADETAAAGDEPEPDS